MADAAHRVSLGFTGQAFPAGVHICHIYNSEDEWLDSMLKYLGSGLASGERTACFTEKLSSAQLAAYLKEQGLSYDAAIESGALSKSGTREVYFKDGRFDPERMLDVLRQYYSDAIASGYKHARVIGEMASLIQTIPGGSRLMEYESRVSILLRELPITSVCQYDANQFDGATIMKVLKVHPYMIIRGEVVHNPFYVQPEEVLRGERDGGKDRH